MAKPKLALVPAAQGSKFYSVLPSDGVGDFDFARASAATRINKYGLIETVASGQSRLNYPLIDGVVKGCPSHLLEPSRGNIVLHSQDLSTTWYNANGLLNSNDTIAPDGTTTADKIKADTTNGIHVYQQTINVSNATIYTMSVFVKSSEYTFFELSDANSLKAQTFNLTAKTISGPQTGGFSPATSSKIEDYGNGWLRCSMIYTTSFTTAYFRMSLSDGTTTSFIGNNTNGLFVWGAQLEVGSYPTSYIPTSGTTVTRVAETANNSGDANTFNSLEGVLMAEISALADDSPYKLIGIRKDTTDENIVTLGIQGNNLYVQTRINNSICISNGAIQASVQNFNKILVKYKSGSNTIYLNGFKIDDNTNTFTSIGNQLNEIQFFYYTNTLPFYGNTKQIQYYDSALTDSELETLTSWTSFSEMAQGQLYTIL
jgi:hypothetical protein